jgi:hypothetical protein
MSLLILLLLRNRQSANDYFLELITYESNEGRCNTRIAMGR